jgi:hypothetical protein
MSEEKILQGRERAIGLTQDDVLEEKKGLE